MSAPRVPIEKLKSLVGKKVQLTTFGFCDLETFQGTLNKISVRYAYLQKGSFEEKIRLDWIVEAIELEGGSN